MSSTFYDKTITWANILPHVWSRECRINDNFSIDYVAIYENLKFEV